MPGAGNPQLAPSGAEGTLNRYSYVLNNPLRYTDPSGLAWWDKEGGSRRPFPIGLAAEFFIGIASHTSQGQLVNELFQCSIDMSCDFARERGGGDWRGLLDAAEWVPFWGIGDAASAIKFAESCVAWPCDPWQAVGIVPLVPGPTGKFLRTALKHGDEAADAARMVTRSAEGFDLAPHFKGGVAIEVTLTEDLAVRRVYGGKSPAEGRWWTTEVIKDAASARAGLALPEANLATDVAEGVIPKGTKIYIGRAEGGWTQIFVDGVDLKNITITGTRPLR